MPTSLTSPSESLAPDNGRSPGQIEKSRASSVVSLVILDPQVDDLSILLADIDANSKVVVLDPQQDGIEQITTVLARYPQLTQVHVVSHGSPGQLLLGNARLSLATLERYAAQLQAWATALQGRDLLLYGCQVAEGVSGTLFLQQLHLLTGANIAASARRVGRVDGRAQWQLETQIGLVQAPSAFSQEMQGLYQGSFESDITVELSTTEFIEDPGEGNPVQSLTITFTAGEGFVPGESVILFASPEEQGLARFFLPGITPVGLSPVLLPPGPGVPINSQAEFTLFTPVSTLTVPLAGFPGDDGPVPGDIPGETETIDFTFTSLTPGVDVSPEVFPLTFFETVEDFEASSNAPPIAVDDSATTDEDVAIVIDVLANDSDPDVDDVLSIDAVTDGTNGTVTVNEDGTLTYTPNADFNGTDSFTYTIGDTAGEIATATVSVVVDPVNDIPVAVDDSATTDEDTAVIIDVLANDTDIDLAEGDILSIAAVEDGASGTAVINEDGTITYTPDAGFNGTDSFTYTVADITGATATAAVSVTVEPADADVVEPVDPADPVDPPIVSLDPDGVDGIVPSVDVLNIFRVLAGAPQAVVVPDGATVDQQAIVDAVGTLPDTALDVDGVGGVVASVDVLNIFRVLAGAPQAVVVPEDAVANGVSQQSIVDAVNELL